MATSSQIIEVGTEFVQTLGFHAFSYRDIADRIGIRTASIHYHFPSKTDLVKAIVERVCTEAAAGIGEIDATAKSQTERLRRFCCMFQRTLGDAERLCPMCMLAMGQEAIPAEVREGVKKFWAGGEAWVAAVVETGQLSGEFDADLEPETVGRTFVAALEGAMVAARAFAERRRLLDVTEYLLASLRPHSERVRQSRSKH
jgi:TetR/AcrR family transcriptional repressor of nem operon